MALSVAQRKVLQDLGGNIGGLRPINAGHMSYHHFIIPAKDKKYFVKGYDQALFSDAMRAEESIQFLKKEAVIYDHLEKHGFTAIPQFHTFRENMLILEALTSEDGWYWRIPTDPKLRVKYIADVLSTLKQFSNLPLILSAHDKRASMDILRDDGWKKLAIMDASRIVSDNLDRWHHRLHPNTVVTGRNAVKQIDQLYDKKYTVRPLSLTHHDARQPNIAWHPKHGVKLVDMSWVHEGSPSADETMFLIDLHKAEVPIPKELQARFDPEHARTMLGYWLQRSTEPHREGNEDVRFHQFVSALVAYDLLASLS